MTTYAKRKAAARDYIIHLSIATSGKNTSYLELLEIQEIYRNVGTRYGLLKELKENGLL